MRLLLGPPLPDLERAGDRAARARRSRTPRPSGCSPTRLGLDDPCFRETDEELMDSMLADSALAGREDELRERGWMKVDLGQGPTPHADGGFGTDDGPARRCTRATSRPRGGRRRAGGALPARARSRRRRTSSSTPRSRTSGASTRPSRSPSVVDAPGRRRGARHRGRRAGARVQRPRRVRLRGARVRRRPPGRAGGADGLVEPRLRGRPQQPGHHVAACSPRRATRRSSTTTAWSWLADPLRPSGAGRSPPSAAGCGPPPRPAARAGCGRAAPPRSTAS